MEGNAQDCNKDKISKSDQTTSTHLMAWRKQMGAIKTRIHHSMVTKLVKDETSLLLRHENSEQLHLCSACGTKQLTDF
jgi:hypothetical protein